MKSATLELQHQKILYIGISVVAVPRFFEPISQEQPFDVKHGVRQWRELRLYNFYRAFNFSSCSALGAWNSVFVPNDFRTPALMTKAVV